MASSTPKTIITLCFAILWSYCGYAQDPLTFQKADKLGDEAYELLLEGKYDVAIAVYERILPVLLDKGDNNKKWGFHALDYSLCFIELGKYKKAVAELEEIRNTKNKEFNDWLWAWFNNYMGRAHKGMGNLETANNSFSKAIKLIKKTDDSGSLSTFLNNYGNLLKEYGKLDSALEKIQQSITILEGSDDPSVDKLAIRYNTAATIFEEFGMYDRAKSFYIKSLEYRKKSNKIHRLATIYNNLGELEKKYGNLDQALVYHNKAIEFEKKTDNPIRLAISYANIAKLYIELDDLEKGKFYLNEAIDIYRQYDTPTATASQLIGFAEVKTLEKKYHEALEYLKRAEHIYNSNNQYGDLLTVYLDMSDLYVSMGELGRAKNIAKKASNIAGDMGSDRYLISTLNREAEINHAQSNYREAVQLYRKSENIAHNLPPKQQLPALKGLAYSFNHFNRDSAIVAAEKAISIMEKLRDRAGYLSTLRAGFFEEYAPFYKRIASWYVDEGNYYRAFQLLEFTKSRTFTEELALAATDYEKQLPDSIRVEKQQYLYNLNQYYQRLDTTDNAAEANMLQRKIISTESDYEAFLNTIENKKVFAWQIKEKMDVDLKSLAEKLTKNAVIFEYAIVNNNVIIVAITNEGIKASVITNEDWNKAEKFNLHEEVNKYINLISEKAPEQKIKTISGKLAQGLLRPVEEELADHENVIIVPDAVLAYMPFETLIYNDDYLITSHNIKYLPSVTSANFLQHQNAGSSNRLLAIAGSTFQGDISYQSQRQNKQVDLPFTMAEVDSIAKLFNRKTIWKDKEISETTLKNTNLTQYKYIHFATHGIIDENKSEYSGLLLTSENVSGKKIGDDGFLRTTEIFNLELNADMVVLSACNTGKGKIIEGEGIFGLQRAFFTAGAHNLVVSLWSVFDRSTSQIMPDFYRQLNVLENQLSWQGFLQWIGWDNSIPYGQKAPAMRRAKLNMLQHSVYKHPVYWAPFIVVGA